MIKKLSLIFICLLLLTACNSQTSETKKEEIEPLLVSQTWQASIMGYSGNIKFNKNGTGTVTYEDKDFDFNYELTDLSENNTRAKITITSFPISEVVGKTADIKVDNDKIKVSYEGFTVNLNPTN